MHVCEDIISEAISENILHNSAIFIVILILLVFFKNFKFLRD